MSSVSHNAATPATRLLSAAGVQFAVHLYQPDAHAESRGVDAAHALGVEPARVFKTLVIAAGEALVVAVVPADAQADLRAVAAAAGSKRARLADRDVAERSTGYVVGGISPLGQRRKLPTLIDVSATNHERIFVNGGRRGLMIELAPLDLVAATTGQVVELTAAREQRSE